MTKTASDKIYVLPENGTTYKRLMLPAAATLQQIYGSEMVMPLLRDALGSPLTWQVRNETSVRKALLSPQLAPRLVAALLALDAVAEFGDGNMPLETYLRRTETRLESLTAVHIPTDVRGRVAAESHVARTPSDEPIVSVRAVLDVRQGIVTQARLAFTGAFRESARVAAEAGELLNGKPLDSNTIDTVAEAVSKEVSPPDDFIGSEEYRRAMVKIATRRALEACKKEVN